MALIVETGSGDSTAESYASVADADTYHTTWGNTAWAAAASTAVKEIALRNATRYLDAQFGARWKGSRLNGTQALGWPRLGVYTADGYYMQTTPLPPALLNACYEMALLALSEDLYPDLTSTGDIASESYSVGPISKSISYVGGKTAIKQYREAGALVRDLVQYSSSSSTMVRG